MIILVTHVNNDTLEQRRRAKTQNCFWGLYTAAPAAVSTAPAAAAMEADRSRAAEVKAGGSQVSHSSVRKPSGATAAGRPSGTTAGVYMRVISVEARCVGIIQTAKLASLYCITYKLM
jgi:hypothetical protein